MVLVKEMIFQFLMYLLVVLKYSLILDQFTIENHNLKTGDKLIYSSNAGDPIKISLDGSTSVDISEGQEFYAVWFHLKTPLDFLTQKLLKYGSLYRSVDYSADVSFDDALVYFSYVGTEDNHKFTTDLDDIVKINAARNLVDSLYCTNSIICK